MDAQLTTGTFMVVNPDGEFSSITVPSAGSGQSVVMDLRSGEYKLSRPRSMNMINVPSAAIIRLASRDSDAEGKPDWWATFKTTHQPAHISGNEDIVYYINAYSKGQFILEGLGVLLLDKSDTLARRDKLGTVSIIVSA